MNGNGVAIAEVTSGFTSILYNRKELEPRQEDVAPQPEFFHDLNLDQVVSSLTKGREEFGLESFLYAPVSDLACLTFRHEVMQDLQASPIFDAVKAFTEGIQQVKRYAAVYSKAYYPEEGRRWRLDSADLYSEAVEAFVETLRTSQPNSVGLKAFLQYSTGYLQSQPYQMLRAEVKGIKADLSGIRFGLLLGEGRITVKRYEEQPDYTEVVSKAFAKFQQDSTKEYRMRLSEPSGMNHIEAMILERVKKLFPDVFARLDTFCRRHPTYIDPIVERFFREIQFYMAYLDYIAPLQEKGLHFCYPEISASLKCVANSDGFDLALASKMIANAGPVVTNSFYLREGERMFVVSGPNQGGKTTFARAFGQTHYLASLGLPIPGRKAQIFLCDRIFTHFEHEEKLATLRGKLQDDLVRIHDILKRATPRSLIIINEIFSSTSEADAVYLGTQILQRIDALDALCVCVTFLDELSLLSHKIVSMVAAVDPSDPAVRTFHLDRRPADGLAHAMAIARKYRLAYADILERLHA